jgi:hypothetical protein
VPHARGGVMTGPGSRRIMPPLTPSLFAETIQSV